MFDGSSCGISQKAAVDNEYVISEEGTDILRSARKKLRLKEDFRFTDAVTTLLPFAYTVEGSDGDEVGRIEGTLSF